MARQSSHGPFPLLHEVGCGCSIDDVPGPSWLKAFTPACSDLELRRSLEVSDRPDMYLLRAGLLLPSHRATLFFPKFHLSPHGSWQSATDPICILLDNGGGQFTIFRMQSSNLVHTLGTCGFGPADKPDLIMRLPLGLFHIHEMQWNEVTDFSSREVKDTCSSIQGCIEIIPPRSCAAC